MKNILFILGFTAVLLACTKEAESVGSSAEDSPITLNLSISSASPDTKSIKKDWDHGDVIYVFFQGHILSDNAEGEQYLLMTRMDLLPENPAPGMLRNGMEDWIKK